MTTAILVKGSDPDRAWAEKREYGYLVKQLSLNTKPDAPELNYHLQYSACKRNTSPIIIYVHKCPFYSIDVLDSEAGGAADMNVNGL